MSLRFDFREWVSCSIDIEVPFSDGSGLFSFKF